MGKREERSLAALLLNIFNGNGTPKGRPFVLGLLGSVGSESNEAVSSLYAII